MLGQGSFLHREATRETKQSCVETNDGLHFNTLAASSFGIMFIPHLGFAGARGDHI